MNKTSVSTIILEDNQRLCELDGYCYMPIGSRIDLARDDRSGGVGARSLTVKNSELVLSLTGTGDEPECEAFLRITCDRADPSRDPLSE